MSRPCTVMVKVRAAVCEPEAVESVTSTEKGKVPAIEGDPVMMPLAARLRPGGREPEASDQVYGVAPPVAASAVM